MSASAIIDMQCPSALQCYICFVNKAGELQNPQQKQKLSPGDDSKKQTKFPGVLCRGCKLQRYCSLQHLVEDEEHRDICRVLIELQKSQDIPHPLLLTGIPEGCAQLQATIAQLLLVARVKLRRRLTSRESELIGYPGYCEICYRLEPLIACEECEGVAYCCREHRQLGRLSHTMDKCQTLAICYSPYRQLDNTLEIEHFEQSCDLQRSHLLYAFKYATGVQIDSKPWRCLADYQRFATCSSFSGIGSVCYALTNISIVAAPHEILSVLVVGAQEKHRRYFQPQHLKFFFLQYPDVRHLQVCFIGHELQEKSGEQVLTFELKGFERKVVLRTFAMTFKHFSQTHKIDPVLIMIYNPDFAALDNLTEGLVERKYPKAALDEPDDYSWHACLLETLYTYGVPICFTSHSKMLARSDITCINVLAKSHDIAVRRVYDCRENPYREIMPLRNPCPADEEQMIYANNYLEVIFTSIKC